MATSKEILNEAQDKMEKSAESLQRELGNIRAGRANASILNRVTVDYYGTQTPVNQMASITIPEARVLMITPFDKSVLKDLEQAIFASDLGLTPANDGTSIRLVIPQLTEERRKELAKDVKSENEKAKVAVRNIRRDAMDALKKGNKDGDFNDDEFHELEDKVQKETDSGIKKLDEIAAEKEKELLQG
ncbi:ribosome-recycling factor [Paucilactobacillus hokkaidonensis JCM 18461]|uniref:Ribosome-recycling factor n=2 Tax=Paucilactobacillus hokkaidonensis TaxID=1193095 RepID=A0A0A1GUT6_9LACO|nr:ribosome recycling factor [Paucilactobacillus hokkaidonensis]KRO10290.1 ribosome recycling factor [Paucilactobacillus hokkaidonensis]BAP85745.1 ribosome-recycling factor [Paucilactobacillus hokkaidonensis JCM 18461]